MASIFALTDCGDGTCCCLPLKTSTILIACISLFAGSMDARTQGCLVRHAASHIDTFRDLLLAIFHVVNFLLLAAVAFDKICLFDLYILYTLSYVIMSLVIAIMHFLLGVIVEGLPRSLAVFLADVAFLFVLSECIPLVDAYRSQVQERTTGRFDSFFNITR